ncbi:MAG: hypothetical protein ACKVJ7_02045 [Candidatus Poseidoniales archaeon]|jgi:hypothetical protein
MLRRMTLLYPSIYSKDIIYCPKNNGWIHDGPPMGGPTVHCIRAELPIDSAEKARESLLNIDTWPTWNSNTIKVLTSDSGKMVQGQKLAFHSMNKGALLETRWGVDSIREGDGFSEICFSHQGQLRMEKEVAKSIAELNICITVLAREGGGVEISTAWRIKGFARIFKQSFRRLIISYSQRLLDDLVNHSSK